MDSWIRIDEELDSNDRVVYRVRYPGGSEERFQKSGWERFKKRHLSVLMGLYRKCGPFEIPEKSHHVPLKIAVNGKPTIAAYLFSIQRSSIDDIAEQLDVSDTTIQQYISDIRNGER